MWRKGRSNGSNIGQPQAHTRRGRGRARAFATRDELPARSTPATSRYAHAGKLEAVCVYSAVNESHSPLAAVGAREGNQAGQHALVASQAPLPKTNGRTLRGELEAGGVGKVNAM